jgi:type VI secretion system protein
MAAALAAGLALSGCAAPCLFDEAGSVTVTAALDANRSSATAVDVVAAGDPALADRLAGLEAGAWFAQRAQFERDFPDTLSVRGWEIAPGQSIGPERVAFPCGPAGLFVFASLRAPGPHRARISSLDEVTVTIARETVEIAQ